MAFNRVYPPALLPLITNFEAIGQSIIDQIMGGTDGVFHVVFAPIMILSFLVTAPVTGASSVIDCQVCISPVGEESCVKGETCVRL